jgi:hypothetical protein
MRECARQRTADARLLAALPAAMRPSSELLNGVGGAFVRSLLPPPCEHDEWRELAFVGALGLRQHQVRASLL